MKYLLTLVILTSLIIVKADWKECIQKEKACQVGSDCLKQGYIADSSSGNCLLPPYAYNICFGNPYCGETNKLQMCIDYNFAVGKNSPNVCLPNVECVNPTINCSSSGQTNPDPVIQYCIDQGFQSDGTGGCACPCKDAQKDCETNDYCPSTLDMAVWDDCFNKKCSQACQNAGYLVGQDGNCASPTYQQCASDNNACSIACQFYGFYTQKQGDTSQCLPQPCINSNYNLPCPSYTPYCKDQGYTNDKTSGVCSCNNGNIDAKTLTCVFDPSWDHCMNNQGACPQACLDAGYGQDQNTKQCLAPSSDVCNAASACDSTNQQAYKRACVDYGYVNDSGKCTNMCNNSQDQSLCSKQLCVDGNFSFDTSKKVCGCANYFTMNAQTQQCEFQYSYSNCRNYQKDATIVNKQCPKACKDQGFVASQNNDSCTISLDNCVSQSKNDASCNDACLNYLGLDPSAKSQACTVPNCIQSVKECTDYCSDNGFQSAQDKKSCTCDPNSYLLYQKDNQYNYCWNPDYDGCIKGVTKLQTQCPKLCTDKGYTQDAGSQQKVCTFDFTTCITNNGSCAFSQGSKNFGQYLQPCKDVGFTNDGNGNCKYKCYIETQQCPSNGQLYANVCQQLLFVSNKSQCVCKNNYYSQQGTTYCKPIAAENCINQSQVCDIECINAGYQTNKQTCDYADLDNCLKADAACDPNSSTYSQGCVALELIKADNGKCTLPDCLQSQLCVQGCIEAGFTKDQNGKCLCDLNKTVYEGKCQIPVFGVFMKFSIIAFILYILI